MWSGAPAEAKNSGDPAGGAAPRRLPGRKLPQAPVWQMSKWTSLSGPPESMEARSSAHNRTAKPLPNMFADM